MVSYYPRGSGLEDRTIIVLVCDILVFTYFSWNNNYSAIKELCGQIVVRTKFELLLLYVTNTKQEQCSRFP